MAKDCKGCGKPLPEGSRARFHNEDCRKLEPEPENKSTSVPTDEELVAEVATEIQADPVVEEMAEAVADAEEESMVTLTTSQFQKLLAAKDQGMTPEMMIVMMKEFAKELRKPDDETAEKIALQKARDVERRRVRILVVQAEMEAIRLRQENCPHRTEKGRSVVSGQVHTGDGLFHPTCQRCGKTWPPRPPRSGDGLATANFFDQVAQPPTAEAVV